MSKAIDILELLTYKLKVFTNKCKNFYTNKSLYSGN